MEQPGLAAGGDPLLAMVQQWRVACIMADERMLGARWSAAEGEIPC